MLIWMLNVPPRVKVFLQRACCNYPPTRMILRSRGVDCPQCCLQCETVLKQNWHIFLTCGLVEHCLKEIAVWNIVYLMLDQVESFTTTCFQILFLLKEGSVPDLAWLSRVHGETTMISYGMGRPSMRLGCCCATRLCSWDGLLLKSSNTKATNSK